MGVGRDRQSIFVGVGWDGQNLLPCHPLISTELNIYIYLSAQCFGFTTHKLHSHQACLHQQLPAKKALINQLPSIKQTKLD